MRNIRVAVIPILVGALGTVPKSFVKTTKEIENYRQNRDDLNHSTVKIGPNSQKRTADLGRLAFTLTPRKDNKLMLVGKLTKNDKIIIKKRK